MRVAYCSLVMVFLLNSLLFEVKAQPAPVDALIGAMNFIDSSEFKAENCAPRLKAINDQFEHADLTWDQINPGFADQNLGDDRERAVQSFALRANLLGRQLFKTRLTLKRELESFFGVQGRRPGVLVRQDRIELEEACVAEARRLLRLTRYAEEQLTIYLYEIYSEKSYTPQMLAGDFPELVVNPEFNDEFVKLPLVEGESDKDFAARLAPNIQTGDLLITRAESAVSGTIARMSDIPGQHSHMILLYKDPETHEVSTVEILVESNVRVRPLKELFGRPLGRMVLFRPKPEYREHFVEATEIMWTLLHEKPFRKDIRIIYDYELDGETCEARDLVPLEGLASLGRAWRRICDCPELICTGMIEEPLSWVAPELHFPRFPSTLHNLAPSFKVDMVGLKADEFFFPVDLEVDPHVDVVAEWRDPRMLRELQLVDVVWTSMLDWMADPQLDYVFQRARAGDSLMSDAAVIFGKAFGLFELLGLVDHSPIANTVPQSVIRNMIVVHKTTDRIMGLIREADEQYVASQADVVVPSFMSWALAKSELERLRQEDAQKWIEAAKLRGRDIEAYIPEKYRTRFHHRFRTRLYPWNMKYPTPQED